MKFQKYSKQKHKNKCFISGSHDVLVPCLCVLISKYCFGMFFTLTLNVMLTFYTLFIMQSRLTGLCFTST